MTSSRALHLVTVALLAACGSPPVTPEDAGTDAPPATCDAPPTLEDGDPDGHAEPLGASAGEARAGRIDGSALPPFPSGLGTWHEGGFVLANDRVAMVIEDVGPSHLYDPWGGRPLGIGRVEGGAIVDPADFGEILILNGRYTVMTTTVSVLADGSDGGPAIVRARGPMRALPFFEAITASLLPASYDAVEAAIDYVLAPDSNVVEIHVTYASGDAVQLRSPLTIHGFMYTPRMPVFAPEVGFAASEADTVPWLAFTDERGVSYAYSDPRGGLRKGVEESGFVSRFASPQIVRPCTITETHHASITIANGRGVDALLATLEPERRVITGVVRDASGAPAANVRVHAISTDGTSYLTRSQPTGDDGSYEIHVPTGDAQLVAYRQGDAVPEAVTVTAGTATADLALGDGAWVHVVATGEDGTPIPARIQLLPVGDSVVPEPEARFGEDTPTPGRIQVAFSATGEETLRVPTGRWKVVVSRGYDYEIVEEDILPATDGETIEVAATLARVIESPGVQCADFHIHTRRSNDSADDVLYKVRAALADGLELPVRSDHEYAADFSREIAALDAASWANGSIGSVEMTSMQIWGHAGVLPLVPDEDEVNAGAPIWQEYPTPDDPDRPLRTMDPPEAFDLARARPESPTVIINHPMGSTNYFGYVGYDPSTGEAARAEAWDDEITAVEFFNDADWRSVRDEHVRYWLSFLDRGRRTFAVGSSDSHGLRSSPVGYPRTCMDLGTDVPAEVTGSAVRDAVAQGRSTISGGIFVEAAIGDVRPGGDAVAGGTSATVHVRVQAPSWVDVDALEIVVDGETVDTIEILPGDAPDPVARPQLRMERDVEIDVADGPGTYVIVAAYGDSALEPVHRGRIPFGVTNPIFVTR